MEKVFKILDQRGEASGILQIVICKDFASLDKTMGFSKLEESAKFTNHPSPSSCGFGYFEKQLPIHEIYPVAVLNDVEINCKMRKKGIGRAAIRAFRVLAEENLSRLGILRIGTTGADKDYETGMSWRRKASHGRASRRRPSKDWFLFGCIIYSHHLNLTKGYCGIAS